MIDLDLNEINEETNYISDNDILYTETMKDISGIK